MNREEKKEGEAEAAARSGPPEPPKAAPKTDPAAPKPYVFKILPADPKRNASDFEDVADK